MVESFGSEAAGVALARQPIFDRRQRLWGYTMRCVAAGPVLRGSPDQALSIASSAYLGLEEISRHGRKLVFDLTEKSVLDQLPYAMPSTMAALRIPESLGLDGPALALLREFKSDGYLIVVAGYSGREEAANLYALADILTISLESGSSREVSDRVTRARALRASLLASGVEDRRRLTACQEMGFDLFEGGFYKSPERVVVRRMTTNEISRLRLYELMDEGDPDFSRIAEAILGDPGLSYRLLAFLNSAAFGFRRRIQSIRHAVTLLGWIRMRNWLRVALLSELGEGRHHSELVYLSAQRGRFLESLGRRFDYWGFDPDSLQLLGLFSMLHAILAVPVDEILLHLPLEERLKGALRGEPGNEYSPLLRLAELFEEGKWDEGEKLVRRLDLDAEGVRESFRSAVDWANQFAGFSAEGLRSP